jgi:hypothetical protein
MSDATNKGHQPKPLTLRSATHTCTRGSLHNPTTWATKNIDLIFNALIGWIGKVCSSLLFYHSFCVSLLLLTNLCVHILCFSFSFICFHNFLISFNQTLKNKTIDIK